MSTVAGTCADTLCAGRFADAAGAHWPSNRAFPYAGRCPREVLSPKGKLGESALTLSPSAIQTRIRPLLDNVSHYQERDEERNRFEMRISKETPDNVVGALPTT